MPTLYVAEVGSRLELEHQRLLVTLEDEIILRIPLERVEIKMGQKKGKKGKIPDDEPQKTG